MRTHAALRGPDFKDQFRPAHRIHVADDEINRDKLVNRSGGRTTADLPMRNSSSGGPIDAVNAVNASIVQRVPDQPLMQSGESGEIKSPPELSRGKRQASTEGGEPSQTINSPVRNEQTRQDSQTSSRFSKAFHADEKRGVRRKPDP